MMPLIRPPCTSPIRRQRLRILADPGCVIQPTNDVGVERWVALNDLIDGRKMLDESITKRSQGPNVLVLVLPVVAVVRDNLAESDAEGYDAENCPGDLHGRMFHDYIDTLMRKGCGGKMQRKDGVASCWASDRLKLHIAPLCMLCNN